MFSVATCEKCEDCPIASKNPGMGKCHHLRLGELLIARKWISVEQLQEALNYQIHHSGITLGRVLLEKRWISREKLERILVEQRLRRQGFWLLD